MTSELEKYSLITKSLKETKNLGQQFGNCIKTQTVLAFYGELGSGKTSFIQGLAKGLKISDKYCVNSPTYTLINEYPGDFTLYHVDLYRINDMEDLYEIGFYDIFHDKSIVAIEWAEKLLENFFKQYLEINLEILDETSRKLSFKPIGDDMSQLLDKVYKRK